MTGSAEALRIGVVGSAHWARSVHVAGARSVGANVVGLWSRSRRGTEEAATQCGVTGYETLDALLDDVDVVTMAVPPYVQAELAVQAARAGKHLLLEKPVATSVESADAIRDAVHRNNVACLVFHTRLFVPEIEQAVSVAATQGFLRGEVRLHYPVMTDPASPYTRNAWREGGHAAYWELGPHALSSSIPVLGPVTAVTAAAPSGSERTVAWTTTHRGGATCGYSLSTFADPALDPCSSFEFRRAALPAGEGTVCLLPDPGHPRSVTFGRALNELVDAVLSGDRPTPHGIDLAVDIVRVLEAAAASVATGTSVYLDR